MELPEFAEITRRIIKKDGFDGFLPTLYFPKRSHLIVLEGLPPGKQPDIRRVALAWAADKSVGDEDFLLAYKESDDAFRAIRKSHGSLVEDVFSARTI